MMSQSTGTVVAVVGLGYVGLPVALAFGQHHHVIGVDLDAQRVSELRRAHDSSGEIIPAAFLAAERFEPTSDPARLREADIVRADPGRCPQPSRLAADAVRCNDGRPPYEAERHRGV